MSDQILTEKIERPHHPWSPSKLQNLEACPCYESRSGGSDAATRGTKQHNVVESGEDDHTLADEHAAAAAECMDFYEQRKQLLVEARQRDVAELERGLTLSGTPEALNAADVETTKVQEFDEIYLLVDDCTYVAPVFDAKTGGFSVQTVKGTTGGYIDKGLLDHTGTRAELFDWKFGLWPVEDADNNTQGMAYVLGWFRKFPKCESVRFWFKQPAIGTVSFADFTRADIPRLELRIRTIVARKIEANARGDFSLARPMIPVCNFCARLGRCEKVTAIACSVASKFHPMEIPAEITPSMVQDPEQTALGLRLAGVLEVWAGAFKRQVNDRIIRREAPIPEGFVLQKRADRVIKDTKKFKATALSFLTEEEFERTVEYAFGKVEKIVSEKAPRGLKEASVKEFGEALLASGAVVNGPEYCFLRAVAARKKKSESDENNSNESTE